VLNVSKVANRDRRRRTHNELDISMLNSHDIPSIEVVLIHPTDKIIKPIIGNKVIEQIPQTTFNKNKLQFPAWRNEKIKEIFRSDNIQLVESYLYNLYSLMEQNFSKNDEDNLLNLLNYFETIIQDKEIANNIINTSFTNLFINILQKIRNDNIKIRVCSIIAYLIRYSTVIETPLDKLGLTKLLDNMVRDKNVELAKRAIATLGEYLFFVTTQAEGDDENTTWRISDESLNTLLYAIEHKDETIKFYSIKAIENIAALTQIAKLYFTRNESFFEKIFDVFEKAKYQELRISAIYTIAHLIRLEPKILTYLLDRKNLTELKKCMEDELPKIQQALLNCILYGIMNDNKLLLKNEFFTPFATYLISMIEMSNNILRIKIILIFAIIFEDAYTISKFGEKLFNIIQKVKKDNNTELHLIIKIFEHTMMNKIKAITRNFVSSKLFNKSSSYNTNNPYGLYDDLSNFLNAFSIIGGYPKLLPSLYSQDVMECFVKIIETQDNYDENVIKKVFDILKNFSENRVAVVEINEFVIKKMFIPILKSCLT
jgi:hypothetical protein